MLLRVSEFSELLVVREVELAKPLSQREPLRLASAGSQFTIWGWILATSAAWTEPWLKCRRPHRLRELQVRLRLASLGLHLALSAYRPGGPGAGPALRAQHAYDYYDLL